MERNERALSVDKEEVYLRERIIQTGRRDSTSERLFSKVVANRKQCVGFNKNGKFTNVEAELDVQLPKEHHGGWDKRG